MRFFKLSFATWTVSVLLLVMACQPKTDDCVPPALEANIVGTWVAQWANNATVEFKRNGTLVDPSSVLFGGHNNDPNLTVKTYQVDGEELTLRAASAMGPLQTLSTTIKVTGNDCNRITLKISTTGENLLRR